MKLRKTFFSMVACILSFVMIFALTACDNTPKEPTVESVVLDVTSVTLGPGDTQRLTATVTLSDGSEGSVDEWVSSSESVATVTRGIIIAKSAGTATVTAKAGEKEATCSVTVEAITVEMSKAELTLEKGSDETLTATVKKNGSATGEGVEWASSAPDVATVDENGKISAVGEGSATITATRRGASQQATCTVTVVWTKPAGYQPINYYEQNKVPTNTWGYWNDPANYVGGTSAMNEAYYQDSADSEAGRANFKFTVNSRDGGASNNAIIQIMYRSSAEQEGGKLQVNHDYKLNMQLTSSVAGKIAVNNVGIENYEMIDIQAGVNNLEATFRHGDWGVLYPEGVYDNVESAVFLLLGMLGEPGQTVTVSIDNLHWTDLGESAEKTTKPEFGGEPIETTVPDLSGVEAISLGLASNNEEMYKVTTENEGKSYNVVYTNTVGESYANLVVDLAGTNAAEHNTFAVTIKNNDASDMRIRFDINGKTAHGANNVLDIVQSAVATVGNPSTNLDWGGTDLNVPAGETVTLYLTYDAATESGEPTQLLIYFHTHVYQDGGNNHSGNVTLGDFKFATVTAPVIPELPEGATLTTTGVDLKVDGEKALWVISGTSAGVDGETLSAYLDWIHFDLQQCGGAWTNYDKLSRTVTIGENGAWSIAFDVTEMPVDGAAYTGHFGAKDPSDPTYKDNPWVDVKLSAEQAPHGKSVTVNGKKYSISNVVGGEVQENNWGCVSLKIENA
ncbi:MAG: Ig domain-containing protein [Clostridia bacterium]|nr:Ig domain-containing protein [Clostridia bacterium]